MTSDSQGVHWAGTESGVLHRLQLHKAEDGSFSIHRLPMTTAGQVCTS